MQQAANQGESHATHSNRPQMSVHPPDFAIDTSAPNVSGMDDHWALGFFFHRYKNQSVPNYQHFRFEQDARYVNGPGFPDVDDQGNVYEGIGTSGSKKANVLDIDPALVGLSLTDNLLIDGFNYGDDPQNGLGPLNVLQGFRYEPVQTEFELAIGNGNKPSDVRAKYDLP